MISFTWFNVIIIFGIFLISPIVLAIVLLVLIYRAKENRSCRIALQWLVLPQFIILLAFWSFLTMNDIHLELSMYLSILLVILISVAVFFILPTHKPFQIVSLFGGHLFGIIVAISIVNNFMPNLDDELQAKKETRQLLDLSRASDSFIDQLKDADFRQKMLGYATHNSAIPEATLRELLARGANPFQKKCHECFYEDFPFLLAVKNQNLTALRVFSEQLMGDDEEVKNNRNFLLRHNPLVSSFYFSGRPTDEQKQKFITVASIVLPQLPTLLEEDVYARILNYPDAELITFLWNYRPPTKRVSRIQAKAIMGDLSVVDEIEASPGLLSEKATSDYAKPLWVYLVASAQLPVIKAILERNIVEWEDYRNNDGSNDALEKAIDRAGKYGDQPLILTLVMRDMLTRGVTYSPDQIAHGFYTEGEGSNVVRALHAAGITCEQLWTALDNFIKDSYFSGKQRVGEVCSPIEPSTVVVNKNWPPL